MWIYSQSSGELWSPYFKIIASGYSGYEEGKNNPAMEGVKSVGPIPKGQWVIGEPYNSERIGPFSLPLYPNGHDSLGRDHFRIHGDSSSSPGKASRGCVIFNRDIRGKIHLSNDRDFIVVE